MTTLAILLSLLGQPMSLHTDLGVCNGTVVGLGTAVVEGTCSLDHGAVHVDSADEDAIGRLEEAHTLPSGRIVVTFRLWSDIEAVQ